MRKGENEKNYILVLRYGYIMFFIIAYTYGLEKINTSVIITLLIYLINNQLRYFILSKKKKFIIPSMILESLLSFTCVKLQGILEL